MQEDHLFLTLGPAKNGWQIFRCTILLLALILAPPGYVFAGEPMVSLSANELNFSSQVQGTASSPQKILLANIGTAELIINAIAIGGQNTTDFSETHNCPAAPATLAAGAICEVQIVFAPKIAGDLSASLSISDNASGSPQTINLKGHSSLPAPAASLSPASLTFSSQPIGTSSQLRVIVLSNIGSATLNITSSISVAGPAAAEFRLQKTTSPCPEGAAQLPPGTSCSIGVVFSPVSVGPKNAQLIVVDDAPGSPRSVALSGTGIGT